MHLVLFSRGQLAHYLLSLLSSSQFGTQGSRIFVGYSTRIRRPPFDPISQARERARSELEYPCHSSLFLAKARETNMKPQVLFVVAALAILAVLAALPLGERFLPIPSIPSPAE